MSLVYSGFPLFRHGVLVRAIRWALLQLAEEHGGIAAAVDCASEPGSREVCSEKRNMRATIHIEREDRARVSPGQLKGHAQCRVATGRGWHPLLAVKQIQICRDELCVEIVIVQHLMHDILRAT